MIGNAARWCRSKFELGMAWLRDGSKRDPSAAQADSFAEANEGKMRRPASVGMTGLGGLVRSAPANNAAHRARPGSAPRSAENALGVEKSLFAPSRSQRLLKAEARSNISPMVERVVYGRVWRARLVGLVSSAPARPSQSTKRRQAGYWRLVRQKEQRR